MKTSDLMTTPVQVISAHDTLNDAAKMMWEHDCGALPVVDETGALIGMLTDRDICMAAYTQGRRLGEIPVTTAMARTVHTIDGQESIERAEALMSEHQVRRIPVIDGDNRPIGILSMNDLAREVARPGHGRNGSKVVSTLAAICSPRKPSLEAT